jgi:hypothetical protein
MDYKGGNGIKVHWNRKNKKQNPFDKPEFKKYKNL